MEVHFEEGEQNEFIRAVGQAITSTNVSTADLNNFVTYGSGGTGVQPLYGVNTYDINTNADWKSQICKDFHVVTEELLSCSDEENIVAVCDRCGVHIFIPRVPGAFSFEKAGNVLGRAMSLDDDDEDEISTLVVEIEALQTAIDKDIRKLKRAMEVLQIARGIARKQLVKAVSEPIE